jgi:hypothetical protein
MACEWWLKAALQGQENASKNLKIIKEVENWELKIKDQQESSSAARKYLFQALLVIFVVTVAGIFYRSRVVTVDDL